MKVVGVPEIPGLSAAAMAGIPAIAVDGEPSRRSVAAARTVSLPAPGGDSGGGAGVRAGVSRGGANNGGSGVPPRGERRFVPDEIITAFSSSATPQSIDQIARRYNLTRLESQSFPLIGSTFYRWRVGGRRPLGGRHRHA